MWKQINWYDKHLYIDKFSLVVLLSARFFYFYTIEIQQMEQTKKTIQTLQQKHFINEFTIHRHEGTDFLSQ